MKKKPTPKSKRPQATDQTKPQLKHRLLRGLKTGVRAGFKACGADKSCSG